MNFDLQYCAAFKVRLQMNLVLVASGKCLIAVLAHQSFAIHMHFKVAQQFRVREKGFRTQFAFPRFHVFRMRSLMLGEVGVSRECLLTNVAAEQSNT